MRLAAAALVLVVASAAAPTSNRTPLEWQISGHLTQGGIAFGTAPVGTVSVVADGVPLRLTGDRRFLIGFGRDAKPSVTIVASLRDGGRDERTLAITPRAYDIESIPSLKQPPPDAPPDPAYEALRTIELAKIVAARAGESEETGWAQAFAWPAHGRISGVYGSQRILGGVPKSPHMGVDVAAPAGTLVTAPASGIIRLAGERFSLEGNLVMLDHGHGLVSAFLHLSRVDVHIGQSVRRGDPIGAIGMTGRATGPHLHWAISWGTTRLDPQLLVGPMPGAPAA